MPPNEGASVSWWLMTKALARVERKLLVAHALIDLQKKAHAILGIALPEFDEEI